MGEKREKSGTRKRKPHIPEPQKHLDTILGSLGQVLFTPQPLCSWDKLPASLSQLLCCNKCPSPCQATENSRATQQGLKTS